jgi:hypothetical protein
MWTYETVETVETTLIGYLAEAVLGADVADADKIHALMNQAIRPAFSVGQPLCKAAVDLACYDLIGKRTDHAVSSILGGSHVDALTLSWTVASPEMAVVEEQLEQGQYVTTTTLTSKSVHRRHRHMTSRWRIKCVDMRTTVFSGRMPIPVTRRR